MWTLAFVLGTLSSLMSMADTQSGACTRDINNLAVVDMCQAASHTLGRVFISVSSSTMGDNSECNCTLRGKTPSQNTATTFTVWQSGNSNDKCNANHVIMVSWPPGSGGGIYNNQNFTCISTSGRFSSPQSTNVVLLTQIRSDPATVFNYCLFLEHENASDNNIELTCQSGSTKSSSTSTSTSTTSTTSTPSTAATSAASTDPTTAIVTSTDSSSATAATGSTVTGGDQATSSPGTPSTNDPTPSSALLGGAIGGGVGGGVVLIIIIVVIVIVCKRRGRQPQQPLEERSGVIDRGYENVLTDNILYESSSGLANNQSPPSSQPTMTNGEGAYQSIDENGKSPSVTYYNTSGGVASVSTGNEKENPIFGDTTDYVTVDETSPRKSGAEPKRTSAPPPATPSALAPAAAAAAAPAAAAAAAPAAEPPSDQYAVVNKPLRQKNPTQNAAAKSKSANVTLPSGDVYAVVDRSTNRGSEPGPAHSPPPEVSPPPAPAPATTPGLVYADLDLVTTPRSSAGIPAPPTDDAEIDHEASTRL